MREASKVETAEVAPGVFLVRDTCNVYVLRSGREAVLVDFGSGSALDRLDELGVGRITDVLVTHHHRDQVQGLGRAADAGARILVPPVERDLFDRIDARWAARQVDNDYDLRQDRFSLLEQVPVAGTVDEYRMRRYGGFDVYTLPTPGHTTGSVTYLVEVDGRLLAFSGDLVYGEGKVWSLAATQWTYSGVEGPAATHVSCGVLAAHEPDVLLPSHGDPIEDPQASLALARTRLQELVDMRMEEHWDLEEWLARPWEPLSPHLLRNRTSFAQSYALLSDSGDALMIDWGYDLNTGTPEQTERSARRPLLASLDTLRRDFGVERIETVVMTHYHDDHVAGINLLREIEGTEVWAPENVAPVLADPSRYDLPCLWFDAVPADRVVRLGEPLRWREYELTCHPLPGHTLYAVAIAFEADGRRVLATGDQQARRPDPSQPDVLNYQYRNRFRIDDFVDSAELYLSLRPDLMVSGHWKPREVTPEYLERLLVDGQRLAELHRELLPLEDVDLGAEGFVARIEPYRSRAPAGGSVELEVSVRNPLPRRATGTVRLVVPAGWPVEPDGREVELGEGETATCSFRIRPVGGAVSRERVAADVTVDGLRFGQQAEALVDVE
jgi:glyoxylase-like metal-dependent hydrolase (beta-lactamase superfamily II)